MPGRWKKSRSMVLADGDIAAQILRATASGSSNLVVSSGKASATFSLAGASKVLGKLSEACHG